VGGPMTNSTAPLQGCRAAFGAAQGCWESSSCLGVLACWAASSLHGNISALLVFWAVL
jgi:hypothetical protein